MVAFRDEMRYLPGFLENVAPQVDGIVALDDGSSDGSAELARRAPGVLEVTSRPRASGEAWCEGRNHRLLAEAAWRHGADWALGVDADERLERDFRARALREIERASEGGHSAYWVRIRELWDEPDSYRVDGVWGAKRSARLFRSRRDHRQDGRELHGQWAPINDYPDSDFPSADLVIYHLRMLHSEDRDLRRARYERLDPDARWQSIGYSYMTDEGGLVLERLPPGRDYVPLGR